MASALAVALPALGPEAAQIAASTAAELEVRSGEALGELEPWLAQRERALVAALSGEAGAEARAELEAEVDATLARYRDRMPARVLAQVRDEGLARRLLARHGLPRLSLVLL
jgi:hypothetical protein